MYKEYPCIASYNWCVPTHGRWEMAEMIAATFGNNLHPQVSFLFTQNPKLLQTFMISRDFSNCDLVVFPLEIPWDIFMGQA